MADSKVVYLPRADATLESELSALVAAYRFIFYECRRVNEKGAQPDAPDAARKGN